MRKKINNGGPAFPITVLGETIKGQEGMSLRDYFAAIIPDEHHKGDYTQHVKEEVIGRALPDWRVEGWQAGLEFEAEFRAAWRYMRADAMLKARDK